MTTKTRIIVSDDNPRDREFLLQIFDTFALTETRNGEEALNAIEGIAEPFVISDIQMPNINGIQLAKKIWAIKPLARILFWSQFSDEMYLRELVKIIPEETVYGYVLKTNTAEVLKLAAHAVFFEHQCWIDPSIRKVQGRLKHQGITDAEYDVLIDIALGLTDKAIGVRRFLSRRGAQNRLKSLYEKLSVDADLPIENESSHLINLRNRAVSVALARGLINNHILQEEEEQLQAWLRNERSLIS